MFFRRRLKPFLLEMSETKPHYPLIVERENPLDTLSLMVEVQGQFFSDEVRKLQDLRKRITHKPESTLGLTVDVKLVEPKTVERTAGKAKRVIDKRNI
jgi:phenylacetate-CoA ligase